MNNNIKKILLSLSFLSLSLSALHAWTADEVDFPGDGNGWSLAQNSQKFTGPDGYAEWFRYTLIPAANDTDFNFKMVNGNDWGMDYGGNQRLQKDEVGLMYYDPFADGNSVLVGGVTAGKRYLFQVQDPGLANEQIAVMELSSDPINILSASRNASTGLITVALSGVPSAEEKVYIRYTYDNWANWDVLQADLSGSTATATIADLKGGATYAWYAFTSTASRDKFFSGFSVDLLTISWDNNAGSNYSFTTDAVIDALEVNEVSADYTTTKFFIDEVAGETGDVIVDLTLNAGFTPSDIQVLTNVNRRDFADDDANGDGIEDGILPPSRDTVTTDDSNYYKAYDMTGSGTDYTLTIPAHKTGAYRLTVRYRMTATDSWKYFNGRDHAVVVSPKKALQMTLYELNTLTVEASAATEAGRSTFIDLLSAADGDTDGYDPFHLEYLDDIGVNALWFQPIHPTGGENVEDDSATGTDYVPGSPYATKDFFAVSGFFGSDGTESTALSEFQTFVQKCDTHTGDVGPINVMLDYVANHSAWDAIYGQGGVDLGFTGSVTQKLPFNWYSRRDSYGQTATYFNDFDLFLNDIAMAPDRNDFGKWNDVADFHYGVYSTLVKNDETLENNRHKNEDDFFYYGSMTSDVINLWRYIAYYSEYWLTQTGHPAGTSAADSYKGIDALRCDFGQGLPNPLWEYIINKTRSIKWDFVFMAETLDGGEPGYRSNRVFDILNENMVFRFTQDHENNESVIQSELETRRNDYRTGAILLNLTSHDEVLPDDDPWVTLSRYGALASIHGLPMIFYGQEKGIQYFWDDINNNDTFDYNDANSNGYEAGEEIDGVSKSSDLNGFEEFELNFGKFIPHFKRWNRLTVWDTADSVRFADGMLNVYGYINKARLASPAIMGINQWYLDPTSGLGNEQIWAVAKYETAGVGPENSDVVLCFANFLQHGGAHASVADTFDLKGTGDALWNTLGLDLSHSYQIVNLASSDTSAYVWATPKTGQDLYDNGVYVELPGGTGVNPISADGELVQYLKLIDVTEFAFEICAISHNTTSVTIQYTSQVGASYTVESSIDLVSWSNEDEATAVNAIATGTLTSFTDLNPSGVRKFYRVKKN